MEIRGKPDELDRVAHVIGVPICRPTDRSSHDSSLEGIGFEPSVPLLRKALLGVANRRRRHERWSHLQVQARDGNACLEWLPIAFPFAEGPRVRIRLPPPASPANSASARRPCYAFSTPGRAFHTKTATFLSFNLRPVRSA